MPASKPSVFPFFLDVFKKRVEGAVFKKLSTWFYSSPALLHALLNRVAFFVEVFNGINIEPVKIRRAINLQPLDSTQNVFMRHAAGAVRSAPLRIALHHQTAGAGQNHQGCYIFPIPARIVLRGLCWLRLL